MLDKILEVVPAGDLMKSLLDAAHLNLGDAESQLEAGKNEGAAVAVGKAKLMIDQLQDVFEKVYTK